MDTKRKLGALCRTLANRKHFHMLKVVHGDLFKHASGQCVIAHGVNPLGVMGDGFAKTLREKYPRNYLEYRAWCFNNRPKLGSWLMVYEQVQHAGSTHTRGLFNVVTQSSFGRDPDVCYVDYAAVEKGLTAIARFSTRYSWTVHFPLIGGGLANGQKDKLIAIFEQVFKDADGVLYLKESSPK